MTSYTLWRRRTTTASAEEPSEQKKICGALLHPLPHLAPSAPLWAAGLIYFFNVTADTAALPSPPPLIYGLHESLLILRGNTCIRCQRSALILQPEWPFCSARPWKLGFFFMDGCLIYPTARREVWCVYEEDALNRAKRSFIYHVWVEIHWLSEVGEVFTFYLKMATKKK